MKIVASLIVLASALASSAHAQTWSPQEKEVLDHVRACWEVIQTKNFDKWVEVCRPTPDYTVWRGHQSVPLTLEASRKNNENFWRLVKSENAWFTQRPVLIQMSGDTAVLYFYATTGAVEDGKMVVSEQKRVETFRKINGKWHVLGGMRVDIENP
jgi:hypothetical protein